MCYSAMVDKAYNSYLRMTGAQMDLQQFAEIYGMRAVDPGIRIPRAIDRWFDKPRSDVEKQIHDMIAKHNSARVTKLETEIFVQRKRLADAERTLAEKPTKKAADDVRISTSKVEKALRELPLYKGTQPTMLDARIFPFHFAPIVMRAGGQNFVRLARYHCRPIGKPASIDRQFPGLYNARRDNLQKFWRGQFGSSHGLMLVESFYENVERDGRNAVLHFVPRPADLMLIACLVSEWTGPHVKLLTFAAITDDPPAEVAAAGHDRMIVNLQRENVDAWLSPVGRTDEQLHALLSARQTPYYEHEVLAA